MRHHHLLLDKYLTISTAATVAAVSKTFLVSFFSIVSVKHRYISVITGCAIYLVDRNKRERAQIPPISDTFHETFKLRSHGRCGAIHGKKIQSHASSESGLFLPDVLTCIKQIAPGAY